MKAERETKNTESKVGGEDRKSECNSGGNSTEAGSHYRKIQIAVLREHVNREIPARRSR